VYEASKLLDDKEKTVAISFSKDIERFKLALSGYTDLTDTLDKVKKSLDQVTHLLTEKVRAEIHIREKTSASNKQIVIKAEEDIYEILKGASIKIEEKPPEIVM
jgi:hypothetical protein